jgi:hypothetical protein
MAKHEITIRFQLPGTPRKRWLVVATAAFVFASTIVYAAGLINFQSHTILAANDLNNNFGNLDGRVSNLESNAMTIGGNKTFADRVIVSRNSRNYSVGSVYCGISRLPASSPPPTIGYSGMKTLCEAAIGCSSSAHMCLPDELVRSAAIGLPIATGWYSIGLQGGLVGGSYTTDCAGWTNNSSLPDGPMWTSEGPSVALCNSNGQPILCCD